MVSEPSQVFTWLFSMLLAGAPFRPDWQLHVSVRSFPKPLLGRAGCLRSGFSTSRALLGPLVTYN